MKQDRDRWNKKFKQGQDLGHPSTLVSDFYQMALGNKALDLAAGTGHNAIFLARLGFWVVAVDLSDEAIRRLKDLKHPYISPVQADLDTFPLRAEFFDLVICCNFLDRRLFPYLQESLKPEGLLIYESAKETDLDLIDQPRNRDYLLRTNELLHSFLGMRILYYQEIIAEGKCDPGKKRVLARLVAQKAWIGDKVLANNTFKIDY